jgi:hypothetical protein
MRLISRVFFEPTIFFKSQLTMEAAPAGAPERAMKRKGRTAANLLLRRVAEKSRCDLRALAVV